MSRYPDKVWQLFREPRRAGALASAPGIWRGRATTPAARAVLQIDLRVAADGRIEEALFQALGCPYLVATGAWVCGHALGRRLEALQELAVARIVEQLELPAVKRYCAVMAVEALGEGLREHDPKDVKQDD